MRKTKIDPADFVQAWQTANDIHELADKYGRNWKTIYNRARDYRLAGIPLRKLGVHATNHIAYRLPELIALAEKYAPKKGK